MKNHRQKAVVVGKDGASHHHDYYHVLSKYYSQTEFYSHKWFQLIAFFTKSRLILLDFEYTSFKFFPLIFLRNVLGLKTLIYAVSLTNWTTETPKKFKSRAHLWLKKKIFKRLAASVNTTIYYTSDDPSLRPFFKKSFKDFQYWDIKFFRNDDQFKKLKKRFNECDIHNTLLFIGRFRLYRGSLFVEQLCDIFDELPFHLIIWSGDVPASFVKSVKGREDITVINEAPGSSEIVHAHLYFKNILLFYPKSMRTSGFFGRGIQAGNYLFVSSNFHVSLGDNPDYNRMIKVNSPKDLIQSFEKTRNLKYTQNLICIYNEDTDLSTIGSLRRTELVI